MSRSAALAQAVILCSALTSTATAQQRAELPDRDNVLDGQPTEVFSVGKLAGERWETLGSVDAVVFDSEDNLYVLDGTNFRVLVFSSDGSFVREFGEQGNGPGELTFPIGLTLDSNGNAVVADLGQNGYTVFSKAGEFIESVPFPGGIRPAGLGMARGQSIASDGRGGIVFLGMAGLNLSGGRANISPSMDQAIIRHALEMNAEPQTLATIPQPEADVQQSGSGGQMRVMVRMQPPTFSPQTLWGTLPDGSVVLAHEPQYSVQIIDGSGRVTRRIERNDAPREVTRRDQDDAREQLRDRLRNSPPMGISMTNDNGRMSIARSAGPTLSDAQIDERVRAMTFADVIPSIAGLRVDPAGRVWIERTGDRVGEDGPIDIVQTDGTYRGTVRGQTLPAAISRSGLAAYIEPDDMDVPRVVVRRIPSGWR